MPHSKPDPPRIPAPAETWAHEPAPVVIRSPAPGIVADPGPAIIINPNPSPRLIWRPARSHSRSPNVSIGWIRNPTPVSIQVFRAIDIGIDVPRAVGAHQNAIPVPVPAIPLVITTGCDNLKLGLGDGSPHLHGLSRVQSFGPTRS